MTNSIADIEEADVILVTGSNTLENHPVIAQSIKRAVLQHGTRLLLVDPRELPLTRYAHMHLRPRPGSDAAWLNSMACTIIEESLYNRKFVEERTEGFEEYARGVAKYEPEKTEKVTGIPAAQLREAARLYAQARRASIFYAMGITQHIHGTENVRAIANLAMLCGHIGKPGTGVNPLRGQNNVQGACDMGALPEFLPGYQRVAMEEARRKFGKAWGCKIPDQTGLTAGEMVDAALAGKLRALIVFGENPVLTEPDSSRVAQALQFLDLLVVQDIFLTETAAHAHYVLPSASFAEKEGTFTSTERRVQKVNRALPPPGEARADGETVATLSTLLKHPMQYHPAAVMEEVASLVPNYGGISHQRLNKGGIQWPCLDGKHAGTPILHRQGFTRGKGLFQMVEYERPVEATGKRYNMILITGRLPYQFHTRTMTGRTPLDGLEPNGFVEINRGDAEKLHISEGDVVSVTSHRGQVESRAHLSGRVQPGVVFMSFHFADENVNLLTAHELDLQAGIPEFKFSAVRLEKVKAVGN